VFTIRSKHILMFEYMPGGDLSKYLK